MRFLKTFVQLLLLALVVLVLAGRALTAGLSHDENKFVYAGQALADRGQLPYKDYPYDQMPYAALFYAVSALLSPLNLDFLAARLLNALTWFACLLVLLAILRLLASEAPEPPGPPGRFPRSLLWLTPIVLAAIFVFDPISAYVLGSAKNNSFATLFALLGFLFLARGVLGRTSLARAAFWSALFVTLAGCTRLNYFSLLFVLAIAWLLFALKNERGLTLKLAGWYAGAALTGALPALALTALAPAQFYYANFVQLRLTTLYYENLLSRRNMGLPAKLAFFGNDLRLHPVNIALYAILLAAGLIFLWGFFRRRSPRDLLGLAAASCAFALLLTAFMATPMMGHYLFAPLPFLLIVAALAAALVLHRAHWAHAAALALLVAALLLGSTLPDSLARAALLLRPASWTPLHVHAMSEGLVSGPPYLRRGSRVLSLLPMIPAEAGLQAYPFTASGSNSWRTSLLLSAGKRSLYGVISPDELSSELDADPPAAILTGFESPNPGFTFRDMGGLEQPFIDFAEQRGYQPVTLQPAFLDHPIILWLRP